MKKTCAISPNWAAAILLGVLAALALPACKQKVEANKTRRALEFTAPANGQDALVLQATVSCRQSIQEAAKAHAANSQRVQDANVLAMKDVTQREQLEGRREVVRQFLASNAALKSLLVNEETAFADALARLNVPPARIEPAVKAFESGVRDKDRIIRQRELDQRMGRSLLGALDLLDELWGQWNYNKEYDQVQFSAPGALKCYNDLLEAIDAVARDQKALQEQ